MLQNFHDSIAGKYSSSSNDVHSMVVDEINEKKYQHSSLEDAAQQNKSSSDFLRDYKSHITDSLANIGDTKNGGKGSDYGKNDAEMSTRTSGFSPSISSFAKVFNPNFLIGSATTSPEENNNSSSFLNVKNIKHSIASPSPKSAIDSLNSLSKTVSSDNVNIQNSYDLYNKIRISNSVFRSS